MCFCWLYFYIFNQVLIYSNCFGEFCNAVLLDEGMLSNFLSSWGWVNNECHRLCNRPLKQIWTARNCDINTQSEGSAAANKKQEACMQDIRLTKCQPNGWAFSMRQLMPVIIYNHTILFPDWLACTVNPKENEQNATAARLWSTKACSPVAGGDRLIDAQQGWKQKRQWCHFRAAGDLHGGNASAAWYPPFLPPSYPFTTTANTMSERQLKSWMRMT